MPRNPDGRSRREFLGLAVGAALAARRPSRAPSTDYQSLSGAFIVVGKRPDGDSIRFIPDQPGRWASLKRSGRIRPSRDGSVQLRLEGIDTPETHFGTEAQPLGNEARDALLTMLGFESVRFKGVASHEVTHAIPLSGARGTIFAQRADGNGRPLCYAFREADAPQGAEQRRVVDAEFMARSINVRMLSEGHAYPGVYTSTPVPHRKPLADAVQAARGRSLGVWARDSSRAFTLESQASIGPGGQLIFPKLFRRCTDYLVSVSKGFTGTLPEWFEAVGRLSRGEAERVWVGDQERHFAELLAQTGSRVTFTADLLDLVFQENP